MIVSVVLPNAGANQSFDFSPFSHGNRGSTVIAATNGVFAVDTSLTDLGKLIDFGFQVAPIVCATSARPNSSFPGQQIFDSTLGYPCWRNASNTGWVNASGATV
jgi:hypothetical protein